MFCKDPFVRKLQESGYNPVLLPRSGILPLHVIAKEMFKCNDLGSITDLFTSTVAAPVPEAGSIVGIDINESAALKTAVGFKVLDRLAPAFNVNLPKLKGAYNEARTMQLNVEQPSRLGINLTAISKYLAKAEALESGPLLERFFFRGGFSIHLITEVLQTKAFSIRATDKKDSQLEVDVDAAQVAASGGTQVRRESATSSTLVYEGTKEITFAFKSFEIGLDGGQWVLKGFSPNMHLGDNLPAEALPKGEIWEQDGFVEFS